MRPMTVLQQLLFPLTSLYPHRERDPELGPVKHLGIPVRPCVSWPTIIEYMVIVLEPTVYVQGSSIFFLLSSPSADFGLLSLFEFFLSNLARLQAPLGPVDE